MERIKLNEDPIQFDGPEIIKKAWKEYVTQEPWFTESQEMVVVFHLNTKNKVIGHHLVGIGTMDQCIAHPRDVFRAAIINNARSIIMVHNHPSGELDPSTSDLRHARSIREAGKMVEIELLDSIIVDNEGENYYSLSDSYQL
jgi:DNA repair protein RadC